MKSHNRITYTDNQKYNPELLLEAKAKALTSLESKGYFLVETEGVNVDQLFDFVHKIGDLWKPTVPFIDVKVNEANSLKGFSTSGVPPHNECCHEVNPPLWICLFCLGVEEEGGAFYLIDTTALLTSLEPHYRNALAKESYVVKSPKTGHTEVRTVFRKHPITTESQLFYTTVGRRSVENHGFNAVKLEEELSLEPLNHHLLHTKSAYQFHKWKVGDLLIFDNYKFMHGRMPFQGSERHLKHIRLVSKK